MIILLKHKNETKTIEIKADAEFASDIMEKAKWIINNINNYDNDRLLHIFRITLPSVTAPDIMSIKMAATADNDDMNKFVAICNILSKAQVFNISPCMEFMF